jgi:HAE1 family hydrophobic/amphiphilic exporter-1
MIRQMISRPVSTFVGTIAATAIGIMALLQIPVALLPSIERPRLTIKAQSHVSSREEMLRGVTEPIEGRMTSVPGISSIRSETDDGLARITIVSSWQTDSDRLRIDVARRVEGAATVPLDDLAIDVAAADPSPVIEIAILGGASAAARSAIAQHVVIPELARADGAGRVDLVGATPRRVTVEPRAADLASRGLIAADVEQALRGVGSAVAAGRVREGATVRPVVIVQPVRSLAEMAALNVASGAGAVPLGDVANVYASDIPDGTSFRLLDRYGRRDGVLVRIFRAPGANAVALSRDVAQRIAALSRRVGNAQLRVVEDRSREVLRALIELAASALLGVILGTFLLRLFLGRWRPALALAIVIPISGIASFIVFRALGVSLDVVSLAGLGLAMGLLVDNSIVVLESIESARARGARDPVVTGTEQIVLAVIASSVTLAIVFAPLLYLRGLARAFFGQQAIGVVSAVAASVVVALTLTPALAGRGSSKAIGRSPGRSRYLALLERALGRPQWVIAAAGCVVATGMAIALLLPRELFAQGSERAVVVTLTLPPAVDRERMTAIVDTFWEEVMQSVDRSSIESAGLAFASDEGPAARVDAIHGVLTIRLVSSGAARATLTRLRGSAQSIPGGAVDVRMLRSPVLEAVGQNEGSLELMASAATDGGAALLASRVDQAMIHVPGIHRALTTGRDTTSLTVHWNDDGPGRVAGAGEVAETQLRAALGGIDTGQVAIDGFDPLIRLAPTVPRRIETVSLRLPCPAPTAACEQKVVPLGSIGSWRWSTREPAVLRDQGRPARRLLFDASRASQRDVSAAIGGFPLQSGEQLRLAGQALEMREAFSQMAEALILSAILLYLTIAAFYESFALPLLVMAALPVAAAGGLGALLLTGQTLNIMSLIGIIFLAGIVVNHTIVLVDRIEQERRRGTEETIAIRAAAADRYRPVMMTTMTAILGMLPLAMIGGGGVELRRAVATTVIGGLLTATAASLLLVPLLHRIVEPYRRPRRRIKDTGGESSPRHDVPGGVATPVNAGIEGGLPHTAGMERAFWNEPPHG